MQQIGSGSEAFVCTASVFKWDAATDQLTEEAGRSEQHHLTPLTSADVSRGQSELYLSNLDLTAFIYSRCHSTVSY